MRYYFHIKDGTDIPDPVGTELADDDVAKSEAIAASGEMLRDLGPRFWNGDDWEMRVVDETGRELLSLHFRGEIRLPAQ